MLMKWLAMTLGGMVLGAAAAIMFVNVTGSQTTERSPSENARTMDRGAGLAVNEANDRVDDRTREEIRADLSGRARVVDGDTIEVVHGADPSLWR